MFYEWSSSLETGHAGIDNQHKQLVAALNALLEACRSGRGQAELERTLDFLGGYTIKHFTDEEKLQQQSNYPDYFQHRQCHEDFKPVVQNLAEELLREGPTDELVEKVYESIGDWLLEHIKGDDFRFAAYLRAQRVVKIE